MRIGVTLSPAGDWRATLAAARLADELGLDAVGYWDHYHSIKPEWGYVCGWSAYGALAVATERIRLVPMVICRLNYPLGVVAKETSVLSLASGGRFELGIGAGDYPEEYTAWRQPFPDAPDRVAALGESVAALREVWKGGLVDFQGEHVRLSAAACAPAPISPPRVVVGVGGSRRLIRSAAAYADELNVYAKEEIVAYAREQVGAAGRSVELSVYIHLDWNGWPDDLGVVLRRWEELGVSRAFVNVGYDWDLCEKVRELAAIQVR